MEEDDPCLSDVLTLTLTLTESLRSTSAVREGGETGAGGGRRGLAVENYAMRWARLYPAADPPSPTPWRTAQEEEQRSKETLVKAGPHPRYRGGARARDRPTERE